MSQAYILASGVANEAEVARLVARPELRRATRNMALALSAIHDLERTLPEGWLVANAASLAVAVGTGHGELDTTIQFLKGLGASGVARPFLFQNSLHNATLGFLSLQLGLKGPAVTVSDGWESGEDAIEVALDLITPPYELALVVGVDGLVTDGKLAATYPPGTSLGEGAGALLLAARPVVELPVRAVLESITRERTGFGEPGEWRYDTDAIAALARAVRGPLPRELRCPKPDGRHTVLRLREELS